MSATRFPAFFASAPVIRMHDPLAGFLGATGDGLIDYRYADAVRLAGHSCPTVAAAFLMTRAALRALYGDAHPERGAIRLDLRGARDAGVVGVTAAVAALIVGAADEAGFRGIGGQFGRRNRLDFGQTLRWGDIRFSRLDTGSAVEAAARLDRLGADPRLGELMTKCLDGQADATEAGLFRHLWQERVHSLLNRADDPFIIEIFGLPNATSVSVA